MDIKVVRPHMNAGSWVLPGKVLRSVDDGRAKDLIRSGLAVEEDAERQPAAEGKPAPAPKNKAAPKAAVKGAAAKAAEGDGSKPPAADAAAGELTLLGGDWSGTGATPPAGEQGQEHGTGQP